MKVDLSDILDVDIQEEVKTAAISSVGTLINKDDEINIRVIIII